MLLCRTSSCQCSIFLYIHVCICVLSPVPAKVLVSFLFLVVCVSLVYIPFWVSKDTNSCSPPGSLSVLNVLHLCPIMLIAFLDSLYVVWVLRFLWMYGHMAHFPDVDHAFFTRQPLKRTRRGRPRNLWLELVDRSWNEKIKRARVCSEGLIGLRLWVSEAKGFPGVCSCSSLPYPGKGFNFCFPPGSLSGVCILHLFWQRF